MGLIKTATTILAAGAIFYGGIVYNRYNTAPKIETLNNRIMQMQTLDYQVLALSVARAENPADVNNAFKRIDNIVNSPSELSKALEQYNIQPYKD